MILPHTHPPRCRAQQAIPNLAAGSRPEIPGQKELRAGNRFAGCRPTVRPTFVSGFPGAPTLPTTADSPHDPSAYETHDPTAHKIHA